MNGSSVDHVRRAVLIAWNKDKLGRQVEVIHTQLDRRDVTNPYGLLHRADRIWTMRLRTQHTYAHEVNEGRRCSRPTSPRP